MKNTFFLILFLLVGQAKAEMLFHNVRFSGNGCDEFTTSSTPSPDGKTLSLIFDEFFLDSSVDFPYASSTVNKECQIEIETTLPAGTRLKKVGIAADFRGFLSLGRGVRASFQSLLMEYVAPDTGSQRQRNRLINESFANQSNEVLEEDIFISESRIFSTPHGGCATERDNTTKIVLKNLLSARVMPYMIGLDPQFLLMMDSADLAGNLTISLQTQTCSPGHQNPNRGGNGRGNGQGSSYNPPYSGGASQGRGNPCRGPFHWDGSLRRCVAN